MKLDVETLRVIYFTKNQNEILHNSPHTLDYDYRWDLPDNITLDNCWNWRLKGDKLVNTEVTNQTVKSLLENNKAEVKKLLIKKINSTRQSLLSNYNGGDYLRNLKFSAVEKDDAVFLEKLAKAANVSVERYKKIILDKKSAVDSALKNTEINKEYYQKLISEIQTNEDLFLLRDEFNNADLTKIQMP